MTSNFVVYRITIKPYNPDIVGGVLWNFDIGGIAELEEISSIEIYVNEVEKISGKELEKTLQNLVKQNLLESFSISSSTIENKNWNEEWEKNTPIIHVTDRITIKPSFKEYAPSENEIVIIIDPKMSFGTGDHATTELMIRLIDEFPVEGKSVLDYGSGTGILSILAAKLGASKVVAIDNDEWCKINGSENVKLNKVQSIVKVLNNTLEDLNEINFDLVTANINKNVLIENCEKLYAKTKKSGTLLVSGLLESDKTDVIDKFEAVGFQYLDVSQKNEWIAISFKKLHGHFT